VAIANLCSDKAVNIHRSGGRPVRRMAGSSQVLDTVCLFPAFTYILSAAGPRKLSELRA